MQFCIFFRRNNFIYIHSLNYYSCFLCKNILKKGNEWIALTEKQDSKENQRLESINNYKLAQNIFPRQCMLSSIYKNNVEVHNSSKYILQEDIYTIFFFLSDIVF